MFFFDLCRSLHNISIKLDSLLTHLEVMSLLLSCQYEQTLSYLSPETDLVVAWTTSVWPPGCNYFIFIQC